MDAAELYVRVGGDEQSRRYNEFEEPAKFGGFFFAAMTSEQGVEKCNCWVAHSTRFLRCVGVRVPQTIHFPGLIHLRVTPPPTNYFAF